MTDRTRELLERALEVLELFDDCAEGMKEEIRAYLAESRPEFVRLSDEEIMDIYMKWINDNNGQPLGRAIEDALEERNK